MGWLCGACPVAGSKVLRGLACFYSDFFPKAKYIRGRDTLLFGGSSFFTLTSSELWIDRNPNQIRRCTSTENVCCENGKNKGQLLIEYATLRRYRRCQQIRAEGAHTRPAPHPPTNPTRDAPPEESHRAGAPSVKTTAALAIDGNI